MKFDVVIGNPPYQEKAKGDSTKDTPVYHHFYNLAGAISDRYCLISPGRFLFNAGSTDKRWNEQMLNDKHLKVKYYQHKSDVVFPGTDIKGGVVVLYRDAQTDFGPIKVFNSNPKLNSILQKLPQSSKTIDTIMTNRGQYRYSDTIYEEHPELMKAVSDRRLASNAFSKLEELFYDEIPNGRNQGDFVSIYGRFKGERCHKWFEKKYMNQPDNLHFYKVIISKANGSGVLGESLSPPEILKPGVGYTETFISLGCFDTENEAENAIKYIKTKFARILLGVLKITQDATKDKWSMIPLQDFSSSSNIDWSCEISQIDKQLYEIYNLSNEDTAFIENTAVEMK